MLRVLVAIVMTQDPGPGIPPAATCPSCRLVRDHVVRLDPGYAILPGAVARVGSEFLIVSDVGTPRPILRFDASTGAYVGQLGRSGWGPGEYQTPEFLASLPGDSTFIFDSKTLRYTVLAPRTYRYVRSAGIIAGKPTGVVLFPSGGTLWVASAVAPSQQVGYPVHLYTSSGDWIRSVGPQRALLRWKDHIPFARRLAPGPEGTVWSVTQYGPMILEVYDSSGRITRQAEYRPPWLPPLPTQQAPGDAPFPVRMQFWVKSVREAWIATMVPAADWQRGIIQVNDPVHGPATPKRGDVSKLFDTVVEMIDLVDRSVIFRVRLSEVVTAILPGGLVVLYREDDDGSPVVTIERWHFR